MGFSINWLLFLFTVFAIGSMFSGIQEMTYLGTYSSGESLYAPFFDTFSQQGVTVFGKISDLFLSTSTYRAIWNMFCWNYAFFIDIEVDPITGLETQVANGYSIVRYVILWPISAAMALAFIITLFAVVPIPFTGRR